MYVPKYFKAYEFVSEKIYKIYGDNSLMFVSDEMKITMDHIREFFTYMSGTDKKVFINTWLWDGHFKSRGYRDPFTTVGAHLSQHKFGRAIDFDVQDIDAYDVRQIILDNQDKFPHIYRMEKNVNWVHIDSHPDYKDKRIYLFKP